jgi:hypothetical protein
MATLPELPQDQHHRTPERKLTNQSLLWVIEGLREFDRQEPEEKVWALEGIVQSAEKVSSADQLTEKLSSADQLTNEEIMTELLRRLPATTSSGDSKVKLTYESTTATSDISSDDDSSDKNDTDLCPAGARPCCISDADIQNACTSFGIQGDDNSHKNDKDLYPAGAQPCRISDADIQNACTSFVLEDTPGPGRIAVSGKLHRVFVVDNDFEFEEPETARGA